MNYEQLPAMEDFVKAYGTEGKFQPIAYYDKHLDCIRVQLFDCSFTEERLNKFLTVLHANHHENDVAGFNIKGVRFLFNEMGISLKGVHKLTSIIDAIVKSYPDGAIKKIKSLFEPILHEEQLEVSF